MKKQILALLLCIGLHGAAMAGLAEGLAAYKEQDYPHALKELAPLAEAGNADAQHALGLMYYMGRGVPRDLAQAFRWHYKAALQGNPAAAYVVGAMYYTGNAVPMDQALALAWFRKAAQQGHPDAQYALGLMYCYHVAGVPDDAVTAYMLFKLAAAGGHRHAREQLAVLARHMTAQQIEEAQNLIRRWQPGMPLPAPSTSTDHAR